MNKNPAEFFMSMMSKESTEEIGGRQFTKEEIEEAKDKRLACFVDKYNQSDMSSNQEYTNE